MILKKYNFLFLLLIVFIPVCQGQDTTGKIVIEYENNWSAVITQNHSESGIDGSGRQEIIFKNPDILGANVTKLDASLNKLIVYIYEDERIAAAVSTREPQGSVSVLYEFPY